MEQEKIRVVIVDDHKLLRQTWKMILETDNRIEVVGECASGEEAIACAAEVQPDVMLMDINMSPVNGFEATEKIAGRYPNIKIIGISIDNLPAFVRHLAQLGAKGYVTKNSSKEEMVEAILEVHNGNTFYCKDVGAAGDFL